MISGIKHPRLRASDDADRRTGLDGNSWSRKPSAGRQIGAAALGVRRRRTGAKVGAIPEGVGTPMLGTQVGRNAQR